MDKQYIYKLIEKYYEGETTLEEEAQIKRYFLENTDENKADALLLNSLNSLKKNEMKREIKMDTIAIKPKPKYHAKWASVAAIIILLLGVSILLKDEINKPAYSDKEIAQAYKETDEALRCMAKYWNKGINHTSEIKYLHEGLKSTENIKYINIGIKKMNQFGNEISQEKIRKYYK